MLLKSDLVGERRGNSLNSVEDERVVFRMPGGPYAATTTLLSRISRLINKDAQEHSIRLLSGVVKRKRRGARNRSQTVL